MTACLKTTFSSSNALLWMRMVAFSFNISMASVLKGPTDNTSALFHLMIATSHSLSLLWKFPVAPLEVNGGPRNIQGNLTALHYPDQCWPTHTLPYGVTRAQWVNELKAPVRSSNQNWDPLSNLVIKGLTHCGQVSSYGIIDLGQHWIR